MNIPSAYFAAGLPNVSNPVAGYCRPITVKLLSKYLRDGELVEQETVLSGYGCIQALTPQQLVIKPEGQRAWNWQALHCLPGLELSIDDKVEIFDVKFRVNSKQDYSLYGFIKYELVEDFVNE